MAKVTGIGGIFFKSPDPDRLDAWYVKHLGVEKKMNREFLLCIVHKRQATILSGALSEMIPITLIRQKNNTCSILSSTILPAALQQVADGGGEIVGEVEKYDFGKFGWFIDPDGNKVELWQPAEVSESS